MLLSLTVLTAPSRHQPPKGLLVMLHGWGANAQDVATLANYIDLPDFQFFFPNAPHAFPYSPIGRMWYDLPDNYSFFSQPDFRQQPQLQVSRNELTDWLRSLEAETGIPLERTVLAGFSQGGAMTLDVGVDLPIAALMVLSGYSHAPIAIAEGKTPKILMVHGLLDQVVPLMAAQQTRDRLVQQGAMVQYHELKMGHEIQLPVLKLMQSFIEESVLPANFG